MAMFILLRNETGPSRSHLNHKLRTNPVVDCRARSDNREKDGLSLDRDVTPLHDKGNLAIADHLDLQIQAAAATLTDAIEKVITVSLGRQTDPG